MSAKEFITGMSHIFIIFFIVLTLVCVVLSLIDTAKGRESYASRLIVPSLLCTFVLFMYLVLI